MRPRIPPHKVRKKIRHLLSQIPTSERPAVNERELIRQSKLLPPPHPVRWIETETVKIYATRNNHVVWRAAAQPFPLANDRPDPLRQRHDPVSRGQNLPFSALRDAIRQTVFAPVFRVD